MSITSEEKYFFPNKDTINPTVEPPIFLNKRSPYSFKRVKRSWIIIPIKETQNIAKSKKLTTTDRYKYIEGPVNFIYLVGDPGDGVERKVLLLGDIHKAGIGCNSLKNVKSEEHEGSDVNVANFCRYIADRISNNTIPFIIDIFIEAFHDSTGPKFSLPQEEKKGKYLDNLRFAFAKCLKQDKTLCDEPMRIHYVDTRYTRGNNKQVFSLHLIEAFLTNIYDYGGRSKLPIWDQVRWPEKGEMELAVNLTLQDARLTDYKFQSIDSSIRQKFKDVVIIPISQKILSFFRDTSNRDAFEEIKNIRINLIKTGLFLPSIMDMNMVSAFNLKLVIMKAVLLDAYFVYRLLKRATTRKPAPTLKPGLTLKPGEPITHVIGYLGTGHTFSVRDMLYRMGFEILGKEDKQRMEIVVKSGNYPENITQCLPYSSIKKSVDSFCTKEE